MSGLGAAGFCGAGSFVAGASVNNIELSCSCKRAACCFNLSVVGSADGTVGTVFGGCCAGDEVSVFDEMLASGVTGGFAARLVAGCGGFGGSGFASGGAARGAVATGFTLTGAGAAGFIAAGASGAGGNFGAVGTAEGAEETGCCAGT